MSTRWSVPSLWPGATVAVLASGPSMGARMVRSCKGMPSIAVNGTYALAPSADMLVAHDIGWWRANPAAQSFAGLRVCGQASDLDMLQVDNPGETVAIGPCHVLHLRNSGLLAIRIAALAGAARIVLYGFDPHRAGRWNGRAEPLAGNTYTGLAAALTAITRELAARRIEVVRAEAPAHENRQERAP